MPAALSIEPIDAARLDSLHVDALAVPMFGRVEQPQGAAGYLDWRLCGRLSRLLREGTFTGAPGETLMLSYHERIRPVCVVLFGLGAPDHRTDAQCEQDITHIFDVLAKANSNVVALGLPEPEPVPLLLRWLNSPAWKKLPFSKLLLLDPQGELAAARAKITAATKKAGIVIE